MQIGTSMKRPGGRSISAELYYKFYNFLYDEVVEAPHGPIRLNANRQIALPKALTDELDLSPNMQVYVLRSERELSGLVVVPADKIEQWIRLGQQAEKRQSVGHRTKEMKANDE